MTRAIFMFHTLSINRNRLNVKPTDTDTETTNGLTSLIFPNDANDYMDKFIVPFFFLLFVIFNYTPDCHTHNHKENKQNKKWFIMKVKSAVCHCCHCCGCLRLLLFYKMLLIIIPFNICVLVRIIIVTMTIKFRFSFWCWS